MFRYGHSGDAKEAADKGIENSEGNSGPELCGSQMAVPGVVG